jgi:hypothetical protein
MTKIGAGINLRIWVQPGRDMISRRVKERAEMHLLAATFIAHRSLRW